MKIASCFANFEDVLRPAEQRRERAQQRQNPSRSDQSHSPSATENGGKLSRLYDTPVSANTYQRKRPQGLEEEQGICEACDLTNEIGQHSAVVNDCYQGNRDVKEAHPEVCNGQVAYD